MRFLLCILVVIGQLTSAAMARERVQIVAPQRPDGPVAYGIDQLVEAISGRSVALTSVTTIDRADSSHVIVAGLVSQRHVADLITASGLALPEQPEALAVCRVWPRKTGARLRPTNGVRGRPRKLPG